MSHSVLRLPAVKERTGKSRSGIYDAIKKGEFPPPISLGLRAVGWLESTIDDWIQRRIELTSEEGQRKATQRKLGALTAIKILRTAVISDDPKIMQIDRLAPEVQVKISEGRLAGLLPISVRWPSGEFAILFCEPGADLPSAENVIEAYHGAQQAKLTFPQGVTSWVR